MVTSGSSNKMVMGETQEALYFSYKSKNKQAKKKVKRK